MPTVRKLGNEQARRRRLPHLPLSCCPRATPQPAGEHRAIILGVSTAHVGPPLRDGGSSDKCAFRQFLDANSRRTA
jgi:hypothetical protein